MKKILLLSIVLILNQPVFLYAFNMGGPNKSILNQMSQGANVGSIADAYVAGREAARRDELYGLEAERIRQETEYLRQLNKRQRQQEELSKEQQLTNTVLGYIDKIKDGNYKLRAYNMVSEIMKKPDPLIRVISYEELSKILQEKLQKQEALEYFELQVKPEILKIHPDFDNIIFKTTEDGTIVLNEEYFQWAEKQKPALRDAAINSSKPEHIIWAISEYKKYQRNKI